MNWTAGTGHADWADHRAGRGRVHAGRAAAAPASRSRAPRQKLDSLADRLMYRLSYRNFGTREALLVNHSVASGGVERASAGTS